MTILSKDLLELQEATRAFSDKEVAPIAQQLYVDEQEISESLLSKMRDMGFFGLMAAKENGGLGMGYMAAAVVTEELSRGWFAVGALPARNWASIELLEKQGTPDQRERFLPGLIEGTLQAAHSGTEPEAGSDAANLKTMATREGDHYAINGTKLWCTNANRANIISVMCRTSKEDKHGGISLIWVEKEPGEQFIPPQLTGSKLRTIGYHGMHSYQLYFDNCKVPVANLIGGHEGRAFKYLMAGYEMARMQFAFRCIGLAQAAYEAALEYSKNRVQFGQPICKFQAIRHKLADMATEIEAARQLGYMVATRMDQGQRADLEAGMVKLYASHMAQRVCQEAVQIHGGNGYAVDYPVNRYWRDSGLLTIAEGTSEIQREVIARRLLGER